MKTSSISTIGFAVLATTLGTFLYLRVGHLFTSGLN